MSGFWNTILTILTLLILLGVLISAHEAGHLAMAKLFGVYCDEFSIGFGPKIFSKRKKGGETTFSLRALPLGGYVSMYSSEGEEKRKARNGEESEEKNPEELTPDILLDPNGNPVPLERSLEMQKTWKRILILLAGVTVNFILSFLFCLIYAAAFPYYLNYVNYLTSYPSENVTSYVYEDGHGELSASDGSLLLYGFTIEADESIELGEDDHLYSPVFFYNSANTEGGYLIDPNATLHSVDDIHVVALYYPSSQSDDNDLLSCLKFYTVSDTIIDETYAGIYGTLGIDFLPDMDHGKVSLIPGNTVSLSIPTIHRGEEAKLVLEHHTLTATFGATGWKDASSSIKVVSTEYWLPFGERLAIGCRQWVNFFPMMGEAIASIFKGHTEAIGGVIAMGAGISQLSSYMGFGKTFFLYGGLISLNLGLVNLLPFPGLDGWSILITILEKIRGRRISSKVKRVMQYIGFGLLLLLALFITIKDVFQFLL